MEGLTTMLMTDAVLASSGSGDDSFFLVAVLLFAPFVVGFFAHKLLYTRYRNQDKRYQYEHTTKSTMEDLQRWDVLLRERRRLRNRRIEGENADSPEIRALYVDIKEMLGDSAPTDEGDNGASGQGDNSPGDASR